MKNSRHEALGDLTTFCRPRAAIVPFVPVQDVPDVLAGLGDVRGLVNGPRSRSHLEFAGEARFYPPSVPRCIS